MLDHDCRKNGRLHAAITVFFLVTLSFSQSVFNNNADLQSLLQFKSGITGDPYDALAGWNLSSSHFCSWKGIQCDNNSNSNGRVISLDLQNMDLKGPISPFLGNLSLLKTLQLQYNLFSRTIPPTLGWISGLTHLNLSRNLLVGEIPVTFESCRKLKTFDVSLNYLSGEIPEQLGRLKTLNSLILATNYFNGTIPTSLSNLTDLTVLDLADNRFEGKIPTEIGLLTKLQVFNAQCNNLTGSIPATIGNCTALWEISLIENSLTGEIPAELGAGLGNLQKLYLWNNSLSGGIPVTLSNLSKLTLLDLSVNQLSGTVPVELGRLKNLEILYFHSNYLVSEVSNSMSFITALTNCSNLKKLHIADNLFAGYLPESVGHFSQNLYYFNLLHNRITGRIPTGIGNLTRLIHLTLRSNQLNGKIPATFGELQQLQRLYLGENRLQGPIPNDLGRMANLGLLDLDENLITGQIPVSFGNLSQLRYLYLSRNRLTGSIPKEIIQCSLLMLLDLSFNKLQGFLPPDLGILSNLAFSLNLSNNILRGDLPANIGNLVNVQGIDLSKNRFSGRIPSTIGGCISLLYLNLSENNLEDSIPEPLSKIMYLQVLDLSFNNLTGKIPISLGQNQSFNSLNLSYNRLTGDVPKSLLNRGGLFKGNPSLCANETGFDLPLCEINSKKKMKKKRWIYFLVAAALVSAGSLLCILIIVISICRSRKISQPMRSSSQIFTIKLKGTTTLTLRDLEIATDGFNEANLLGRGSFGSVYKAALQPGFGGTVVAVKVLNTDSELGHRIFKRECKILAGIRHRNLVAIVGAVWHSNFKALVLDFVDNGSLESHLYPDENGDGELAECDLTVEDRLRIAIDIGHALEYLHDGCSFPTVHCDLKPSNVLLDHDMMARVADFGIARLISGDRQSGMTTITAFPDGTVGYIPPEYGLGVKVSEKGDIYSFGIIMLEMLTRKKPTGSLFIEGLDLRKWVASFFPTRVLDVVDGSLIRELDKESRVDLKKLEQCFIELVDVGLMCTEANPQRRPTISWIVHKLEALQKVHLCQ